MKKTLMMIFKIVILLVILVALILGFNISFNVFERMFVGNQDYLMITNSMSMVYAMIASIIITFFAFLFFFPEESKVWRKKLVRFRILGPVVLLLFFGYIFSFFQIHVVYEDQIISYSLFSLNGRNYSLADVDHAQVKIKKGITKKLTYTLYFKDHHKVEIFENSKDFGMELEEYDNLTVINKALEKANIAIDKDDKNLESYLSSLEGRSKQKVQNLFR